MWANGYDLEKAIRELGLPITSPLPIDLAPGVVLPAQGAAASERIIASGAQVVASAIQKVFAAAVAHVGVVDLVEFNQIMELVEFGTGPIAELVTAALEGPGFLESLPHTIPALLNSPLVQELARQILGTAVDVVQAVPLVGWVIAIVVSVVRIFVGREKRYRAARSAAARAAELEHAEASHWRDQHVFDDLVWPALQSAPGEFQELDWTILFLPPGIYMHDRPMSDGTIGWVAGGGTQQDKGTTWGLGVIPGSGLVHQGAFQNGVGGEVYDPGQFLPLAQTHVASLWQLQIVQSGAGLFGINTQNLERLWLEYLIRFRNAISTRYPRDVDTNLPSPDCPAGPPVETGCVSAPWQVPYIDSSYKNRKECRQILGKDRCKRENGSGHGRYGYRYTEGDANKIIDFFADPARLGWTDSKGNYVRQKDGAIRAFKPEPHDIFGVNEAIPVQASRWLRQRQFKALDTLLCAYVDQGYVAIAQDSELRTRWQERRAQLLEHPGRCRVQMDSVPTYRDAGIYRERLIESGATHITCGLTNIVAVTEVPEGLKAPPFATGAFAIPTPEPTDHPSGPPAVGTGTKIALAGAAGLGAYGLYRYLRP